MQRKARLEPDDDVYGHPPSRRARHRKKRKRPRLLPRLQGRGAGGRAGRAGREDVRRLAPRVYRGVRAQDEAFAGRGRPAARHDRRL